MIQSKRLELLPEMISRVRNSATRGDIARVTGALVSDVLPELAAVEHVFGLHLDDASTSAISHDHSSLRLLAERIAMLDEGDARRRHRAEHQMRRRALDELIAALDCLAADYGDAVSKLTSRLGASELASTAEALDASAAAARRDIVLIAQAEPGATEAHVFRRRPDLDRAYSFRLTDLKPEDGPDQ